MEEKTELRHRTNLGNDECKEVDKLKKLKIYICTWNVSTKQPKLNLNNLLKLDSFKSNELPDIYVVGLQEVSSNPVRYLIDLVFNDPWTNELTKLLSNYNYIRLKSTRLVGILLNIYVKKPVISYIRYSIIDWVRLGFFGLWGNKGANICSINLGNFSVCFINSHLSAHEHNDSKRTKEYKRIAEKNLNVIYKTEKLIEQNYIFFFGDLNYRLNKLDMDVIKEKIINKDYEFLLKHDQLKLSIENGDCFNNFKENEIKFAPTYKFDIQTDTYDTSKKKRKPAWCDRIFFKLDEKNSNTQCEVEKYDSIAEYKLSDHKPVYGFYHIKLFDWETQGSLVKFKDIQGNKKQELEILYLINEDLITHPKDWIGLYKNNFSSSNDFQTYVWSERIQELEKIRPPNNSSEKRNYFNKTVLISNSYLISGKFVVGYYSYVLDQLVGISDEFTVAINWI